MNQNVSRRVVSLVMALILCVGMIPAVSAADPQPAMWFMDHLSISQVPGGNASHKGTLNFDVGHGDKLHANIKAPFDCKIVKIHLGDVYGNTVIIESQEKVLYADGTVDYMSMAFGHDNNVNDLKIGQTLKQGEVFYQTGTKGLADKPENDHAHVTCIKGKYKGDMWTKNKYGKSCSPNAIDPTKALFIPKGIVEKGKGSNGLKFVTYDDKSFSVTLDPNGGTVSAGSVSVKKDAKVYGTLPTPTRDGYSFKGWYDKTSGGTKVTKDSKLLKNSAHTLYAQWTACKHTKYFGGLCEKCGYEAPYKVTAMKATAYQVTKKGGAPIWSRPYSNASTNLETMAKGSIVMVVGKTTNIGENGKPHNQWYLLSDGRWIYSGNVKAVKASNVKYVFNTDGVLNVNKTAKAGTVVTTIPEGGSVVVNKSKSSGKWLYVTYNGKSGYAYSSYLVDTAPTVGIYSVNKNLNGLYTTSTSGKVRNASIKTGDQIVVFTNRLKDNRYMAIYNYTTAGYIHKSNVTKLR